MIDELNRKLLIELAKLEGPWESKKDYSSEEANLRWLPVATLCGGRFQLGLTSRGLWARSAASFVYVLGEKTECVFFLPMLEDPLEIARCKIADGLKGHGLPDWVLDLFPFERVVIEGLRSQSAHWSGLALKWALFVPGTDSLKAAVYALSRNGETQQIRHSARKLAKQLKTS